MSFHPKSYIGDGAYVVRGDTGDLILTTENGIEVTNRIVLEPSVWESLKEYAEITWADRLSELARRENENASSDHE